MGQEFHVVRCFSCQSFQVQQVKKVNRWSCKLCGEKQSLVKEYGRGSGADCRRHVQKLNAMRGALMEEQECNTWSLREPVEAEDQRDRQPQVTQPQVTQPQVSRWRKYLDTPQEEESEEEQPTDNVLIDRQQLIGNNIFDRTSFTPQTLTEPCYHGDRKRKRLEDQADTAEEPSHLMRTPPSTGTRFLSSDCQGFSVCGRSQCCPDTTRPHPLLPGSAMFQSGEEFSFDDDDFLTQHSSF